MHNLLISFNLNSVCYFLMVLRLGLVIQGVSCILFSLTSWLIMSVNLSHDSFRVVASIHNFFKRFFFSLDTDSVDVCY